MGNSRNLLVYWGVCECPRGLSDAQIVKNMYAMPQPTVNIHPPMDDGRRRDARVNKMGRAQRRTDYRL